jgi:hypothetical protein
MGNPKMFSVRSGLPSRRIARLRPPSNKRFFVQSLCDGFLDLAIALPFPPSVPAYSATIILVTVASRLALFPIALWVSHDMQLVAGPFAEHFIGQESRPTP